MQQKRARVESSQQKCSVAPAKLVAEAHDVLMECSRKHLGSLLAVLLKQSSVSAIEEMLSVAEKLGCFKPKSAPFQLCSHSVLNSVFSYLPEDELGGLEIVCRRWRVACKDSSAGWISALGRRKYFNEELLRELAARNLNPALVWTNQRLDAHYLPSRLMPTICKISHLTELDICPDLDAVHAGLLDRLTNLKTLKVPAVGLEPAFRLPSLTELRISGDSIDPLTDFKTVQESKSIRKLAFETATPLSAEAFAKLPNLSELSLTLEGHLDSIGELAHLTALRLLHLQHRHTYHGYHGGMNDRLIHIAKLTQLTALMLSDQPNLLSLAPLTALHSLKHFGFEARYADESISFGALKLSSLAILPLQTLRLRNVQIKERHVKQFAKFRALKRLVVWNCLWWIMDEEDEPIAPDYALDTFIFDVCTALPRLKLYVSREEGDKAASSENVVVFDVDIDPLPEFPLPD